MKANEKRIITFERKILWRIFGPKKNIENTKYERKTDLELGEMLNEPDKIVVLKSRDLVKKDICEGQDSSQVHNVKAR